MGRLRESGTAGKSDSDRDACHPVISGPSNVDRFIAEWLRKDSNTRWVWVRILNSKKYFCFPTITGTFGLRAFHVEAST